MARIQNRMKTKYSSQGKARRAREDSSTPGSSEGSDSEWEPASQLKRDRPLKAGGSARRPRLRGQQSKKDGARPSDDEPDPREIPAGLDHRIKLSDVRARMHAEFRQDVDTLQQRNGRFRAALDMVAWGSSHRKTTAMKARLARKMEELGINLRLNLTRGMTPGLVNLELGEAGGRVPRRPGSDDRLSNLQSPIDGEETASEDTDFEGLASLPSPFSWQYHPTDGTMILREQSISDLRIKPSSSDLDAHFFLDIDPSYSLLDPSSNPLSPGVWPF
ncbi:hypothetical protein ASPZODRAFT_23164 [Penicilliopsis zonata CBS 506.65]|uniref:Uncharacterized protein n=1 Tax=Penicilliopsis zonata CBS 506.65 TaxID=1073090 RepID=A0A1L9SPC0_9EURO|nr:hypothetical protein ASPZODRAFT_23164 [Penicilliopsis zonata CBS 506.65]OJJ48877.1 hypothetical protein ASPZODRAFT_23164 [Penicilliopsis zonata CBS 506.65]